MRISFGPFELLPAQQLLERGQAVRIGSRALALLEVLVGAAGEIVSKEELIARVWPTTLVDEVNLRVQLAGLRKALGDGRQGTRYIVTIPGRGFQFVAPVSHAKGHDDTPSPVRREAASNLPAQLTRMLGRDEFVPAVQKQMLSRRMITVVGPGGIGKTTAVLAIARGLTDSFRDGVWCVDLASIQDPRLVASALATVLGVPVHSEAPLPSLMSSLVARQMLVVLDNCEHVIGTAAHIVEELYRNGPGIHVIATSREPLRSEGETVIRLAALSVPPASVCLTAAGALEHSAIQLFVERATECVETFALNDDNAPIVAEICRKLDGLPLAIEMAAARVESLALADIVTLLNERFRLLIRGRRTALARHRTLLTALDWSYDLLTEAQQLILRRIGIFAGWFTMGAVSAVLEGEHLRLAHVVEQIAELVAKSLVVADVGGMTTLYRLPETMRAYAGEKLSASGELNTVSRLHARLYVELFDAANLDWQTMPAQAWLAHYRLEIDNVRSALDWSFSPRGDAEIGRQLTIAATPLWLELLLVDECRQRAKQALSSTVPGEAADQQSAMKLHTVLAWTESYNSQLLETCAWDEAFKIANALGDQEYRLRSLWGMWSDRLQRGRLGEALGLAKRFASLVQDSDQSIEFLVGERMLGTSLHLEGEHRKARHRIERMLEGYVAPSHGSHLVRFQIGQEIAARGTFGRILWLQGFADQAMLEISRAVEQAVGLNQMRTLCDLLAYVACPMVIWMGHRRVADHYVELLLELTSRDALQQWRPYARCFEGQLVVVGGDIDRGVALQRAGIGDLRRSRSSASVATLFSELALAQAQMGLLRDADLTIRRGCRVEEGNEVHWSSAELLRVRGDIAGQDSTADHRRAEGDLLRSLRLARQQGAIVWELRAWTSLLRFREKHGRRSPPAGLLKTCLQRTREGSWTTDVVQARGLIDHLGVTCLDIR